MKIDLTPEKALIFRIVHRDNLPWILDHGLHCRNSGTQTPNYVEIGNPELIAKRTARSVPRPPGGTLGDYVPFYFTPYSPMMLNIKTGHGGIAKRSNDEIVILVSSLRKLNDAGVSFLFTDRHAYLDAARFSSDLEDLEWIDWHNLQNRDFKKDLENPDKFERYQAEALIHRQLPLTCLIGIVCHDVSVESVMKGQLKRRNLTLETAVYPSWYFR
jgi:ssDNA thymidine ADP-ribosyltransferase, DarT